MTENQIKEALSVSFLSTIVHRCGHKIAAPAYDHGMDLTILEVGMRTTPSGGNRHFDSGRTVQCQLKATTENKVTISNGLIKYGLENKTYNDLISRRDTNANPLILMLFILPDDATRWVECQSDKLVFQKHLFWYSIPDTAQQAINENSRTTIDIPDTNVVNLSTMPTLFDQVEALTRTP